MSNIKIIIYFRINISDSLLSPRLERTTAPIAKGPASPHKKECLCPFSLFNDNNLLISYNNVIDYSSKYCTYGVLLFIQCKLKRTA